MFRLFLSLGLVISLMATIPAASMDYSVVPIGGDEVVIGMGGPIVEGDAQRLLTFMKSVPQAGSALLFGFALNSPGGLITEAEAIAQMIRSVKGERTIVGDRNVCASACFLIFAAGERKLVHIHGKVIVHATSSGEDLENIDALAATTAMARDAAELGVPSAIIGKMVVTPPGQIQVLSRVDLQSMGVVIVGDNGNYIYPRANTDKREK